MFSSSSASLNMTLNNILGLDDFDRTLDVTVIDYDTFRLLDTVLVILINIWKAELRMVSAFSTYPAVHF